MSHRRRLGSGEGREIDVYGAAGPIKWVCESKWHQEKVGLPVLKNLLSLGEYVKQQETGVEEVYLWLVSRSGLTPEAEDFAKDNNILWSSEKELNDLLQHSGLRPLFNFKGKI